MRRAAAGALACALAASLAAAPAQARPRALIAFLPAPAAPGQPLLYELARRGLAIGLTSPTVGGFKKRQMALDMSQGSRIPTRIYSKEIGALRLKRGQEGWVLSGWQIAQRRAEKAPGDVVPGLLAASVKSHGGRVEYVGVRGRYALGAIVAADEGGHLAAVSLGDAAGAGARAASAFRSFTLTVADLPPGPAGLAALDRLLAVRGRDGIVYVVRSPEGRELRLLPSAAAGAGLHGQLRSATTRRTGLIAATDVAPTVLRHLGLPVPADMQGEPIEPRGSADPAAVRTLDDRLAVVISRRGDCLRWLFGAWLVLLLALRVTRGSAGVRAAVRAGLLAALWLPGVALVAAAIGPGRVAEAAMLALGSLALGAVTDRVVSWPMAPVVPAVLVFIAHAVDLARGSPLIGESIAGPNPAGGARFFGIGNELETILSFSALIAAGAALAWAARRRDVRRAAPPVFALAALVAAGVMGAGRLGADVGAVITLGAGGAAAVVASLRRRPSRRALAVAIAAPVAAVGALILLDVATGGGAHLTRSVLHAHGSGDLADVVRRRFRGSFGGLRHPAQAVAFAIAVAIVVSLVRGRERLLLPLRGVAGGPELVAALTGAFFAVVVGAVSNDSGPLILEIGAVLLALGAGYAASPPSTQAR
ncbi:MAG: hypothetical protein ACJ76Z_06555 [Thermoleophilaceae bacterium]